MKFFAMVRLAGVLLLASSLPVTFGCVRVVKNVVIPDDEDETETQDNTSNDSTAAQPQPKK